HSTLHAFPTRRSSDLVAIAGSFTADGKGNITEGIEDENGPTGSTLTVPLTGTYNVGSDNCGAFTITTASGSKTYALVLNSISSDVAHKARFVEFDDTSGTKGQRGSGLLRLQDPSAFTLGSITGPYAFGFSGQDAAGNREAIVGAFNASGSGTISTGIADQNVRWEEPTSELKQRFASVCRFLLEKKKKISGTLNMRSLYNYND